MKVKQVMKILEKCEPEALVMVGVIDDNGNAQMVEATVVRDVRSGDVEICPTKEV